LRGQLSPSCRRNLLKNGLGCSTWGSCSRALTFRRYLCRNRLYLILESRGPAPSDRRYVGEVSRRAISPGAVPKRMNFSVFTFESVCARSRENEPPLELY
jgi:hypothetical protein